MTAAPSASVSFNSQRLTNLADPSSAQDSATKNYADSFVGGKSVDVSGVGAGFGNGKTLVWDSVMNRWTASTVSAGVTQIIAGPGLTGGTITSTGTISIDSGTTANKVVRLDSSAQLPPVDGSQLRNIRLASRAVSSTAPSGGQVLAWNAVSSMWEPQTISAGTSSGGGGGGGGGGGAMITETSTRVGIGTSNPMAVLDVSSSGSGGSAIIIPRDSTANRPGTPVNGMLRYNTTTGKFEGYEHGAWTNLISASSGTGSSGSIPSCALGEILYYSLTGWACTSMPSGGSGTSSSSTLASRPVSSASPSTGQVLTWNGSVWEPQTISTGTGGGGGNGNGNGNAFGQGGNAFGSHAVLGTSDAYPLSFRVNNSTAMTIVVGGRVGIGTTSPVSGAVLEVASLGSGASTLIIPRDTTQNRPASPVNGMFRYNTTLSKFEAYEDGTWVQFTTSSDARLKTDVVEVGNALDMIDRMRPVYYNWDFTNPRTNGYADKHQVGFIAQELEEVLPEVVNQGHDSYRTVEYGKITAVAIAAAKELKAKVKSLTEENAELKAKLEQQERDLQEVKKRLGMP